MSLKVDRRAFLGTTALLLAERLLPRVAFAETQGQRSQNTTPTYEISEIITGNRIGPRFQAYYRVQTNIPGSFYIVQYKDSDKQKIFTLSYDLEDKRQGRIFPRPQDSSKPVAVIKGEGANLDGVFEIYDRGEYYSVNYNFSPLIYIPSHTEINSRYLLNIDESLKDLPTDLVSKLNEYNRKIMLANNVEDSYYWLYPSWKEDDDNSPINSNRPWIEKINGQWVDNRRHENVPGYYFSDRHMIVMPQKYIRYGTEDEVIDRTEHTDWNKATVFHEIGHAVDYLESPLYSDVNSFVRAYNTDLAKIPASEQERVGYFLMNRREPFAELVGALLGGFTRDRAARILDYFPDAAEHIRINVLPEYGYEITDDDVRENIYPDYRKNDEKTKTKNRNRFKLALLHEDPITLCA